jgi:hypothetical protein
MEFHAITAEDGRWARPLLEAGHYKSCEFTFVNIYMWSRVYNSKIARHKDFVIARSEGRRLHYLYPAGRGNVEEAIDAILEDAAADGREPVIFSLDEAGVERLQTQHPGRFHYEKPRGEADYLYRSSDLADLPGRRYQKKRNHCSRFERDFAGLWAFHEISHDSIDSVCAFNNRWCRLYDNRGDEGIEEEHRAIGLVCRHYNELNLKGGYLTVNSEVVAFSFGSPLGPDIFVTHVEKALYDTAGAYAMINREMARRFGRDYQYINRENDLDEPGLREAKLSYHPVMLEEKYTAEWIAAPGGG